MNLFAFIRRLTLLLALAVALPAFATSPWTDASLISNGSATGAVVEWPGGIGVFAVSGTFGGATVTLSFLGPDGATYIAAGSATTCTATCASVFYLPHCYIEAVVTGGSPTALYAAAARVPT